MEYQNKLCEVSKKAKIVINKCLKNGYDIDVLKLQQLLTLMQGTMLARYNITFFPQQIIIMDDGPLIREIMQDVLTNKINLETNNSDYILTISEESVVDDIIKRFGIYDCSVLNTSFVLNVLNKIHSAKEKTIVPMEYLKIVFLEFGYDVIECDKENTNNNDNKVSNGMCVNFAKKYADLVSTDFPRKWMSDPETRDVPLEHDLVQLAEKTVENGFVENYCLDEYDVKQLRLIRYYKKNYNQ